MPTYTFNNGSGGNGPKKIKGCKVICELPAGTKVRAYNNKLIACHPNHAPIVIDGEGVRTLKCQP